MNTRLAFILAFSVVGCAALGDSSGSSSSAIEGTPTDAEFEQQVVRGLRDSITGDIDTMKQALTDIQTLAPVGDSGWDPVADAATLAKMREAWVRARESYERVEGVVAPVFPFIDLPLDDRYEGQMATIGSAGDQNLFDGRGVTGMHAIERILYLETTPAHVVEAEATIPGYKAAAFPRTRQEAQDFKTGLCAKALSDASLLRREWSTAQFAAADAFAGLVDLMIEQREKVNKASSFEEESRYSQRTMADLRQNLTGTKRAYEIFVPWITSKAGGSDIDAKLRAGFDDMGASYARVPGAAIPTPPDSWSSKEPTKANLQTPFGQLFTRVRREADPNVAGSVVSNMNAAATLVGIGGAGR